MMLLPAKSVTRPIGPIHVGAQVGAQKGDAPMKRGFGSLKKVVRKGRRTTIYASYAVPYDVWLKWSWTPKRVSKSFPQGNKGAAEQWLAHEHKLLLNGQWKPESERRREEQAEAAKAKTQDVTIGDYWQGWLSHRTWRGHPLRPGTVYATRLTIIHHILPTLGAVKLSKMTQAMADRWESSLTCGPEGAHNAYKILRAMFHSASLPGWDGSDPILPRDPLTRAEPMPPRKSKTIPATPEQIHTIYQHMPADRRLAILLTVYAGALRIGEVCGLQVGDIDLKSMTLSVHRERETIGKNAVGPTKTQKSVRTVPIPRQLVPAIKAHIDALKDQSPTAWLFPARGKKGIPVHPNSLRTDFEHARLYAHRPDLRFHDLRHTSLTMMAENGADLRELMDYAGHSTPGMALKYQHAVQSRKRQLAAKMGNEIAK